MLFQLPTFHALLAPCPVGPAAFTPHADGKFCSSCQRVVQDFSRSENPVADLAAARAAAPDGRVCGSFRREQVVVPPAPTLSRRLRWFVVALVLVLGQGLTARQALAQVQKPVQRVAPENLRALSMPIRKEQAAAEQLAAVQPMPTGTAAPSVIYGAMVEAMPTFRGGGNRAIIAYIQQRVVWPQHKGKMVNAQGRLFASFTVGADGQVRNVEIVKTFNPLFNEPVLEAIRAMRGFKPGFQNGRPVAVSMTAPISFILK